MKSIPAGLFSSWDESFTQIESDLTVSALYIIDPEDTDGDRLLDSWELEYFEDINATDGLINSDSDEQSDYNEFLAGSDPKDGSQYFRIIEERYLSDTRYYLKFTTSDAIANRRYKIRYTDDLLSSNWAELSLGSFQPDTGAYTEKTFDLPGSGSTYFFKVEAYLE